MKQVLDITLRVWWDDEVTVDRIPTIEASDWDWDGIVCDAVPAAEFVSVLSTNNDKGN